MDPIVYDPRARERAQLARVTAVAARLRHRQLMHGPPSETRIEPDDAALEAIRTAIQHGATLEERLAAAVLRVEWLERANLAAERELQVEREANAVLREQVAATVELLRDCEAELRAANCDLELLNVELQEAFNQAVAGASEATSRVAPPE
jgi:hypothetical protein